MRPILSAAALAVAVALAAGPPAAEAQPSRTCADREKVLGKLEADFGETRQSYGLAANSSLIEVYASAETGTWTILVTTAQGLTCILAAGQAFENTEGDVTPVKGELL